MQVCKKPTVLTRTHQALLTHNLSGQQGSMIHKFGIHKTHDFNIRTLGMEIKQLIHFSLSFCPFSAL